MSKDCLSYKLRVLQQDNDPKHTAKSTQKLSRTKDWTNMDYPSMGSYLNGIEHQWKELKHLIWRRCPSNPRQLEQFAQEEWVKLPVLACKSLIGSYSIFLLAIIGCKGCATNYWVKGPIIFVPDTCMCFIV